MKSLYGKICGLLFAGFFAVTSYPATGCSPAQTPSETQGTAEKKDDGVVRILAIGNSFSQDAVEQYLYELFDAAGIKVVIGNMYIPGCSLERHYNNSVSDKAEYAYRKIVDGEKTNTPKTKLIDALLDEPWDYISLQQASGKSGEYDTYNPYLKSLISYLRRYAPKKDFKLVWHQTWAYSSDSGHGEFPKYGSDQMQMYEAIVAATKNALKDNKFDVLVPSGTAIQNARTSYIGDKMNRDGYHLELNYGRYTAACTWFEAISGKKVVGNSYAPATVDDGKKAVAQNAAHEAVRNPYKVTIMKDFQTAPSAK